MIQLWGGTQDTLLKSLQVMQNKAGRQVTGLSWFTPSRILLQKCRWLSIKQLVAYHTILAVHKITLTGHPKYLSDKICQEKSHVTRHQVKFSDNFPGKSERTGESFCYRGAKLYNKLPLGIQQIKNIDGFKRRLKIWTKENIPYE